MLRKVVVFPGLLKPALPFLNKKINLQIVWKTCSNAAGMKGRWIKKVFKWNRSIKTMIDVRPYGTPKAPASIVFLPILRRCATKIGLGEIKNAARHED
jgi:hypothetical protein